MHKASVEFAVGLFVILGGLALLYLSVNIGGASFGGGETYTLEARFISSSGLKPGAVVEIGGVRVGKTNSVELDPETYESVVQLELPASIIVPDDSIASIRTAGIIGDKFIKITPGGSDLELEDGEEIIETESSLSIEELVSKYLFDGGDE